MLGTSRPPELTSKTTRAGIARSTIAHCRHTRQVMRQTVMAAMSPGVGLFFGPGMIDESGHGKLLSTVRSKCRRFDVGSSA